MRKEAKLSRVPAVDEESINVPIKFLGMAFDVTAPASQADEMDWKWSKWARPLAELYRNSLSYKTVPTLKSGTRRAVAKTKFMLSMSDAQWMFNWSKAQQIMEINVNAKINKSKVRRLTAFAIGIMLYDFGIKPAAKNYFARKVKRENIKLDGIQKFLKVFLDGMALGRPRTAFAFGFMMHMEQVSKALQGHPLHAMVGEILFDKDTFETDAEGYERFQVSDDSPLNYEFAPERFDTVLNGMSTRKANAMKRRTWGGRSFEEAMDMTGIAPFQNALKKYVIAAAKNPSHPKHRQVLNGLGLRDASELDENAFYVAFTKQDGAYYDTTDTSIHSCLWYRPNGRSSNVGARRMSRADRTSITRDTHYNSYVVVEPAFRRLGAGMHMTASQIEAGLKMGRKKITVHAALDGGWKTWNQFGFESDRPFLSEAGRSSRARTWADKSVVQRLDELGDVDRQEIMKILISEMISSYNLKLINGNTTAPQPPPPPQNPLPTDRSADVLKIMMFVLGTYSSYSAKMLRVLEAQGLPTSTNKASLRQWYASNTVTETQQQAMHNYFKNTSGMSSDFRRQWGYPPRTSVAASRTTSTSVDTWLKNKIIEWDWFNGQPFNKGTVLSLLSSPQFDVVHGLDNLKDVLGYLKAQGYDENSYVLKKNRLTTESQTMQDCMDCEGFNAWWKGQGGNPDWHGHVDLTDGKYALAVLAMDHYRKLKIKEFPELANDPAYQRARVASDLSEIKAQLQGKIDPDIIEHMSGVDAEGGIGALDMALVEMALRNAKQEIKDMKAETPVRVASRWLEVK